MILSGTVMLAVSADVAAEGFHDPETLAVFLPANSQLSRTGPAAFDFVVVKEAGVVTLRLPGSLTVAPEETGYRFSAAARHILGGSATLSLHLAFAQVGTGCEMSYEGTLESTGLAGRLLRDRADQAQDVVDAKFGAVKERLERSYRSLSA